MVDINLTPIYQDYCIDMSSNNNFVQVPSVQGDGNYVRYIRIMLISNNVQYEIPENIGIYVVGTKPDTKMIFNNCEIDSEGRILVEITSQMSAVNGRGDYQIMLIDNENNAQLKTFPFYIMTTKSFNAESITSSNEYQALTEALAQMQADYEHYVVECAEHADAAATSETNAKDSENAAKASENASKASENASKASENAAKESEDNAKASEDAAKISEQNASASELAAKASEDAAKISEDNAKDSENAAKISEDNAKVSEINAKESELNAKSSENNAKTSEDNAKTSEDNAKISENNAKSSEDAAAESAQNASISETNSAESETNAENYADLSKKWAEWTDGANEPSPTNNARYWAGKAKEWSGFDDIDASDVTYTKEDGSKVQLSVYLKFLEDLDDETILVL